MKYLLPIVIFIFALVLVPATRVRGQSSPAAQTGAQAPAQSPPAANSSIPPDQENAHKAHELLDQAIQALGGPAYLGIHDTQEQGRVYTFYHGRPNSNGVFYWRFQEYPDKEGVREVRGIRGGFEGKHRRILPLPYPVLGIWRPDHGVHCQKFPQCGRFWRKAKRSR